jgi:hypothetical protein
MAAGTYLSHCHLFALAAPAQHLQAHGGHAHGGHLHGAGHVAHGAGQTGVAFFCGLPFVIACAGLLALFVVLRVLQERNPRPGAELAAWPFAVLAPVGFFLHHHLDHLLGTSSLSFAALVEPHFLLGLLLQIPIGLLTYIVAKLLLRVAASLGLALSTRRPRRTATVFRTRAPFVAAAARIALLARAAAPRAPPAGCVV